MSQHKRERVGSEEGFLFNLIEQILTSAFCAVSFVLGWKEFERKHKA